MRTSEYRNFDGSIFRFTSLGNNFEFDISEPHNTADYIIFKDSGRVYAKNGKTGRIEFNSSDIEDVISSVYQELGNGGVIFIKKGVYEVSEPIELSKAKGILITGEHGYIDDNLNTLSGTVLKAVNNMEAILKLSNHTLKTRIFGISFDGEGLANYGIYISDGGFQNHVKQCDFHSFKTAAIYVNGSTNAHYGLHVYENMISGIKDGGSQYGILIGSASTDNMIAHNIIRGCDTALYLKSGANLVIQNHFSKTPGTLNYGIYFEWAPSNVFISNQIDNPEIAGFAGWADRQIIVGNFVQTIKYDTQYGLYLDPPSSMTYTRIIFAHNFLYGRSGYVFQNSVGLGTNASLSNQCVIDRNIYDSVLNITKLVNVSTATFSSDGSTAQFKIEHSLVSTPSKVLVTPMSADAAGDFYVTADNTYIYVNYTTAPPAGTDNVKLSWYAEV